jgi:hypothetical protein
MNVLEAIEEEARRLSVSDLVERELSHGIQFGPYHREWLLARAPESVRRQLALGLAYPGLIAGTATADVQMQWPNTSASFGAINTTTTETNVIGTVATSAAQFAGIAATDPFPGKRYQVAFGGIISNTGTPTVIWTPRWGQSDTATSNTTLGASPTITTVASLSNHAVYGQFDLVFRAGGIGATAGTATGNGFVVWGNSAATGSVAVMGSTVPTNLGIQVAQGLMVSLTWGTSSASNTFTCQWFHLVGKN